MKTLALLMTMLVLSGVAMPAAAAFVSYQRAQDPCGMVFCCCPQMCKMIKHKKFASQMCDNRSCGMRSASSAVSLSPFSLAALRVMIVSNSLIDPQSINSKVPPERKQSFNPADRSPLDKPPPFLS